MSVKKVAIVSIEPTEGLNLILNLFDNKRE
jgi:hypothetical protein